MRSLSSNALAKIVKTKGTEPLNQVEIQWTAGGQIYKYGDKLQGVLNGQIISLGNIDSVINSNGSSSDSQSVSVTLNDTDGVIKSIMDVSDIHKRPVWIYQTYQGLDDSDKFLLFKGQISSPIVWKEDVRQVSFDVLTQIENEEIGFSAEEGQFPQLSDELAGEPWPIGFGTVAKCKALQLTKPLVGTLATGFGVPDPIILLQIKNLATRAAVAKVASGSSELDDDGFLSSLSLTYACDDVGDQIGQLQDVYYKQVLKARTSVDIINGDKFPQGVNVTILINGKSFTGTFVGTTFHFDLYSYADNLSLQVLVGPKKIVDGDTVVGQVETIVNTGMRYLSVTCRLDSGINQSLAQNSGAFEHPRHPDLSPGIAQKVSNYAFGMTNVLNNDMTLQPVPSTIYDIPPQQYSKGFDESKLPPALGFFEAASGATVTLASNEPIDYVVNILPSTVLSVCSEISPNNVDMLIGVPTSYYTVFTQNYGPFTATIVRLHKPLTSYAADRWTGNDLYVSYTSTVGPNICDIIEWLVETYSNLTIDAASFTATHSLVDCYGANFCLHDRQQVLTVIKDIAWQSRCALWLVNDVVHIKYLPLEPDSVADIDSSNIMSRSLQLGFSSTEDLVTKFVAKWRANGYQQNDSKIILRHNINKYGTIEQEYDFYIYSDPACVLKSATFWLIRYANTWKRMKFTVFLDLLNVETFDCVTIDTIKAIVESAQYDSSSNSIQMDCWLPVRAGEQSQYLFAWPADIAATERFPTEADIASGAAGGQVATGTIPIGAGTAVIVNDLGDPYPSDISDVCCTAATYICDSFVPYELSTGEVINYAQLTRTSAGGQATIDSSGNPPTPGPSEPCDGGALRNRYGDCCNPGDFITENGDCCPEGYSNDAYGNCNNY